MRSCRWGWTEVLLRIPTKSLEEVFYSIPHITLRTKPKRRPLTFALGKHVCSIFKKEYAAVLLLPVHFLQKKATVSGHDSHGDAPQNPMATYSWASGTFRMVIYQLWTDTKSLMLCHPEMAVCTAMPSCHFPVNEPQECNLLLQIYSMESFAHQ